MPRSFSNPASFAFPFCQFVSRRFLVVLQLQGIKTRTDIRTIDETKEIDECNGWNDHQIDLPRQPPFGCLIELDKGYAVSNVR